MRLRSLLLPLAALLLRAPVGASRFEVADDWPAVTFNDGVMRMVMFVHMPDLDVPGFDLAASSGAPAPSSDDVYVPLHALTFISAARKDGKPEGDIELLTLAGAPTGYRLYLRLDPKTGKRAIKRGGGAVAEVGTDLTPLFDALHLATGRPEQVLVMVRPGRPAAAPPGALGESEQAAIASMEPAERAAGEAACAGAPGAPGSTECWRGEARKALAAHAQEAWAPGSSPFTQRYLRRRLSAKGYARLERSLEPPAGQAWRRHILDLDMREIAASAAPPEKTPAAAVPVVAAKSPAVSEVPQVPAGHISLRPAPRPAGPVSEEITRAPAAPAAPAPQAFPVRRLILAFVVLSVIIFLAFRRNRGK